MYLSKTSDLTRDVTLRTFDDEVAAGILFDAMSIVSHIQTVPRKKILYVATRFLGVTLRVTEMLKQIKLLM